MNGDLKKTNFIKKCKNTRVFKHESCTRWYELHENFSKHIGKPVCRHGEKPCNKETELLGTLKASITTTQYLSENMVQV